MKKLYFLFLILYFYLACTPTTTNKTTAKISKVTEIISLNPATSLTEAEVILDNDLEDYLRKTAGVSIVGFGRNVVVYVRGITKPRFVVNGNQIGTDFQVAADYVRHQQIKSIRILRYSQGVATIHGRRADTAEILIETE